MGSWKFKAVGLENRRIRQEEVNLMCQLLPPSILALIARDDVELDVVHFGTNTEAKEGQIIAVAGDTA